MIISRSKPHIFHLSGHSNESGRLTFFEGNEQFPFPIHRSFWIMNVPIGDKRGVHAHKEEIQVLVAVNGNVTVSLTDISGESFIFDLNSPEVALYIPAMIWSEVLFGKDTILLGLSDRAFDENDYIRDKKEFEKLQQSY